MEKLLRKQLERAINRTQQNSKQKNKKSAYNVYQFCASLQNDSHNGNSSSKHIHNNHYVSSNGVNYVSTSTLKPSHYQLQHSQQQQSTLTLSSAIFTPRLSHKSSLGKQSLKFIENSHKNDRKLASLNCSQTNKQSPIGHFQEEFELNALRVPTLDIKKMKQLKKSFLRVQTEGIETRKIQQKSSENNFNLLGKTKIKHSIERKYLTDQIIVKCQPSQNFTCESAAHDSEEEQCNLSEKSGKSESDIYLNPIREGKFDVFKRITEKKLTKTATTRPTISGQNKKRTKVFSKTTNQRKERGDDDQQFKVSEVLNSIWQNDSNEKGCSDPMKVQSQTHNQSKNQSQGSKRGKYYKLMVHKGGNSLKKSKTSTQKFYTEGRNSTAMTKDHSQVIKQAHDPQYSSKVFEPSPSKINRKMAKPIIQLKQTITRKGREKRQGKLRIFLRQDQSLLKTKILSIELSTQLIDPEMKMSSRSRPNEQSRLKV